MSDDVVPIDEVANVLRKRDILRRNNATMAARIESVGITLDGLADARIEHLLDALADFGVLTPLQAVETKRSWEDSLNAKLMKIEANIRRALESKQRAQAAQPVVVRNNLLGPDGRPVA